MENKKAKFEADSAPISRLLAESESVTQSAIKTILKPNDDNYNMNHKYRGKAIIFNHFHFDNEDLDDREGTSIDCESLNRVLGQIGFQVIQYNDLKLRVIEDKLEELRQRNFENEDCIAIFVLTHGVGDKLYAKDRPYLAEDLYEYFTPNKCPTLAGKPKLFFINACRGEKIDHGILYTYGIDSAPIRTYRVSSSADFLTVFSGTSGFISIRSTESGSFFIQSLCQTLEDSNYNKLEFKEILTIATRKTALMFGVNSNGIMTQVPSMMSSLIRNVYFTPKLLLNDMKEVK